MIRNNNPGNIRYNPNNNWVGQIGFDYRGFVIFDTLYNGVRAMVKLILNYIGSGDDTLIDIIMRYAPPNENNTLAYVNSVIDKTGIQPLDLITHDNIHALIDAMIEIESGESVSGMLIDTAYYNLTAGDEQTPTANSKNILVPAAIAAGLILYFNT